MTKKKISTYRQIEALKESKREKAVLYEEILLQDLERLKEDVSSTVKSNMWGLVPKIAFFGARSLIRSKLFKKR